MLRRAAQLHLMLCGRPLDILDSLGTRGRIFILHGALQHVSLALPRFLLDLLQTSTPELGTDALSSQVRACTEPMSGLSVTNLASLPSQRLLLPSLRVTGNPHHATMSPKAPKRCFPVLTQ